MGGTCNLLHHTLPRTGITTAFVDSRSPEAFRAAPTPRTPAIYLEALGNPKLDVPGFALIAALSKA